MKYQGIKLAIGTFKCTRVDVLKVEEHFIHLKYRRTLLRCQKYFLKTLIKTDHHISGKILGCINYHLPRLRLHPYSFIERVKDIMHRIDINYRNFHSSKLINQNPLKPINLKINYAKEISHRY